MKDFVPNFVFRVPITKFRLALRSDMITQSIKRESVTTGYMEQKLRCEEKHQQWAYLARQQTRTDFQACLRRPIPQWRQHGLELVVSGASRVTLIGAQGLPSAPMLLYGN